MNTLEGYAQINCYGTLLDVRLIYERLEDLKAGEVVCCVIYHKNDDITALIDEDVAETLLDDAITQIIATSTRSKQ